MPLRIEFAGLVLCGVLCAGAVGVARLQEPATTTFAVPPTDSWPTYNGDYSGRRFSPLSGSMTRTSGRSVWRGSIARTPAARSGGGVIKSTPLQVDGVLYFSVPDHVWAVDARTGRERWHYVWPTQGREPPRPIAAWQCSATGCIFETPDCHLVSLNRKDGTERWRTTICDLELFYYGAAAPVIIGNHVITGISGDDLDNPGYIESHDPESGERQWRWYTVPQKKGDPGAELGRTRTRCSTAAA